MTVLAGTGRLVRLAVRLDRVRLAVWIVAMATLAFAVASAFQELYPTIDSRRLFAGTLGRTPALVALTGRGYNLLSIGGLTSWRIGGFGATLVGLLGIFTVVRHTRAEEEAGRLELVGSAMVGRYAPLVAALAVAFGATLAIGIAIGVALSVLGEPAAGSLALGLAFTSAGWSFAALAAVAAQLTHSARAAGGLAGTALGLSFLLRAAGDSAGSGGMSILSWLSPIGWSQLVRPFANERWEVFLLPAGLVAVCVGLSAALVSRRDLGEGLIPARPGPADAAGGLDTPARLAWRIHRGQFAAWLGAFVVLGSVFGLLAEGISGMLDESPELAEIFERMGGVQEDIVRAYFAAVMGVVALLAAAYAIQAALRLRSEELAGRLDPVLASPVSRGRWLLGHVGIVLGGVACLLFAAGFLTGLVHGLQSGGPGAALRDLAPGALLQFPAVAVMAGLTVALFGLWPRASAASWAALAGVAVITQLGGLLQFPTWVLNLSPFEHAPVFFLDGFALVPTLLLIGTASALTGIGLLGFVRRDVG